MILKPKNIPIALASLCCLAALPQLSAQNATPHIGYVSPAGGQQGTTFQVTVGGRFLNGADAGGTAFVTGSGIQADVLGYSRPLTPQELNTLRERFKALQSKRAASLQQRFSTPAKEHADSSSTNAAWTVADQREFREIRQTLFLRGPMRNANPAIAEWVTLNIAIAANAEPGERELRLRTPSGLSNPLRFCVGQLPEFRKPEKKLEDDGAMFQRLANNNNNNNPARAAPLIETEVSLPAVINGQVLPGGVDRFRFHARPGEKLVFAVQARALIPYLADAVPGWFQPALSLHDASGNELAFADHNFFDPDPVLFYSVEKEGEYTVQICDALYRGRDDFVYRITAGEVPFVTAIFPLGGRRGTQTTVTLTGWNLPVTRLTRENREPGIDSFSLTTPANRSNPVHFAVDTLPEYTEHEPNNSEAEAQRISLPAIINGRIESARDKDVFRFEGRAGEVIVAEVRARRLGSPLDSMLKLTDKTGNWIAFNDDQDDPGAGLETHHADSYLRAVLPADQTYYLHLWSAQHRGGPEFAYRLRLSPPQPDFALRVTPSSINIRPGMSVPLTVHALRSDGFTNEIALALENPLPGFEINGGKIPADQEHLRVTLTAPSSIPRELIHIAIIGRAVIANHEIVHRAVPAEEMQQAFAYHHLVPAQDLVVAAAAGNRFAPRARVSMVNNGPVKIPAGGAARIQIILDGAAFAKRVSFELDEPPDGITVGDVSPASQGLQIEFRGDASKVKPGLQGNLILRAYLARAPDGTVLRNQRRAALATLPAIPFEVVSMASEVSDAK